MEIEKIKTATKSFNENIRKWEYVLPSGQVLITCKTEKGLDSNWKKYLNVWS